MYPLCFGPIAPIDRGAHRRHLRGHDIRRHGDYAGPTDAHHRQSQAVVARKHGDAAQTADFRDLIHAAAGFLHRHNVVCGAVDVGDGGRQHFGACAPRHIVEHDGDVDLPGDGCVVGHLAGRGGFVVVRRDE